MLDINIFFQNIATPFWDSFFLFISNLTNEFLYIAIVAFIYYAVNKEKSMRMAVIIMSNMSLNFLLKDIFCVDRPFLRSPEIVSKDVATGYGYSFPSGHSQFNSGFYSSLVLNFRLKIFYAFIIFFVLLVGFSRIYLGVHTVLDVAAGILAGFLWSVLINFILIKYERKKYFIYSLLCLTGVLNIVLSGNADAIKILLLYIGFVLGNFLENKYVFYKIPEKVSVRMFNFFMFLIGIVIIFAAGKFFSDCKLSIIKYFLTGIWATYLCPFICVKRKVSK